MTTVNTPETVRINDVEFPLKSGTRVRHVLSSTYAPKVVIGDTSRDSQQRASVLTWLDWRDGIGVEQIENSDDTTRSWFSTLNTRFKKHLVLSELVTQTASSGQSGIFDIGAIASHQGRIYAAHGSVIYLYSGTSENTWTSVKTLAGSSNDSISVTLRAGIDDTTKEEIFEPYLVFASGTGFSYLNRGTWTDVTRPTAFVASWDDDLWGISGGGTLWQAITIGVQTPVANLPIHAGKPTGLFVGRSPAGPLILYVATTKGLWVHDVDNGKFIETELNLPEHPDNGKGHLRWRDATYITSGLAMYKYVNGANNAVVTLAGPDLDYGVPLAQQGTIVQLISTQNEIFALVNRDTTGGTEVTTLNSGADVNRLALAFGGMSPQVEETTGTAWIGAYDGKGWRVPFLDTALTGGDQKVLGTLITAAPITAAATSDGDDAYRLYFARNRRVYWMDLQRNIINPNEVTTLTFTDTSTRGAQLLETPWFDAGQEEVDKIALRLKVEVEDATSTEAVSVFFAIDGSSSYTKFTDTSSADSTFNAANDRIQGNGTTTFTMPTIASPTGTAFRSIRFKVELVRGSTTTLSPDVISITLEWRKKIPAQYAHLVTIDLNRVGEMTGESSGFTREALFDQLRTIISSNLLVSFTFRDRDADDSGVANAYTYYVDVSQEQGLEQTGEDWGSEFQLTLVEV